MHKSSMLRMKCFVEHYVEGGSGKRILDIGSYNVNGCYKPLFSNIDIEYVGLDIEAGPNVDVVMDEIYSWNSLEDDSFDYIISGQAFEHIEYPWLTIKEISKKLKSNGIVCIIAPNSLFEHKFPVDCYRYYGDGMRAIAEWGGFKVIEVSVAGVPNEAVSSDWDEISNDVCLVACKSESVRERFANKVMFPVERRFEPVRNLKLQYDFMSKWKCDGDKIDKLIIDYIERGKYEEIYIVGNENVGIALGKLFQSNGIVFKILETEKVIIAKDLFCEVGRVLDKEIYVDKEKRVLCILTIIDASRSQAEEISREIHPATTVYIDDMVKASEEFEIVCQMREYFQKCSDIYIFGAGVNGYRIMDILSKNEMKISGFVVSDSHYREKEKNDNIYKISDISKNSGIIISPNDDDEIKRILKEGGYTICFDGKKIL